MIDNNTFETLEQMIYSNQPVVYTNFSEEYGDHLIEPLIPLICAGILKTTKYQSNNNECRLFELNPRIIKIIKENPEHKREFYETLADEVVDEDLFLECSRGN
ncbi:MAG: hypothetical protein Q7S33_05240 [Nanoarchaeota archaeon]|nr:hypothetical protein [Nanoarchaeota archaeon]